MRILYFNQYFTVPSGSYSTRVYEFARRWVKAGDSVTVVTSVYDKSGLKPDRSISRFNIEGIDVRMVNIHLSNNHGVMVRVITFIAYALIACWYALRLPADVVLASSGPLTVGVPGLLARYVRRLPLVFEVRDLWPEGAIQLGVIRNKLVIKLARFLERTCYRAATTVVVLSEGMSDWIRQNYGYQNIEVIPNASDNELFGSAASDNGSTVHANGKKLVLYTGSIGAMNDCWQIVKMAECLQSRKDDCIDVVLIGDGKDRRELEEYVHQTQLGNVRFLGNLPKKDVAAWLTHASCALLAFRAVPCMDTVSPNKMFDALAAGVPVVQSTQGWIKRLLEKESCGITVPSNSPEAMADAVQRLACDEKLRNTFRTNARRVARQMFDRDLLAAKMHDVLARAAAN